MFTSRDLKAVITEVRPIIERQLDDADLIASFRETVTAKGGDWSQVKALVKAMIQDERDDAGGHRRVLGILHKADHALGYADMLGLGNLNEKNSFSADPDHDPITGEVTEADNPIPVSNTPVEPGGDDPETKDGAASSGETAIHSGADGVETKSTAARKDVHPFPSADSSTDSRDHRAEEPTNAVMHPQREDSPEEGAGIKPRPSILTFEPEAAMLPQTGPILVGSSSTSAEQVAVESSATVLKQEPSVEAARDGGAGELGGEEGSQSPLPSDRVENTSDGPTVIAAAPHFADRAKPNPWCVDPEDCGPEASWTHMCGACLRRRDAQRSATEATH